MEKLSKKLMNWASILEDNTREQALLASTMPFVQPHLALTLTVKGISPNFCPQAKAQSLPDPLHKIISFPCF